MEALFWASFGLLLYTYIGYPVLIMLWARLGGTGLSSPADELPSVTVVIAVYNENDRIAGRLENIFSQDYPAAKLDVVVVSDGSTDGTSERLRRLHHPRLTAVIQKCNRGKASALNQGVARATGEIVLFTDARQYFARDAIRNLVAPFSDARVGGTTGELVLCESKNGSEPKGVGLYWRYEKAIREAESRVDSVVGATGAIYAIRRALYRELPPELILDDVLTPLHVISQGYRLKMVRNAIAYDRLSRSVNEEFRRKVRTLAGNLQLVILAPWVLNPMKNRIFFQWFSHKMCRLLAPFGLIGLFLSPWFLGGTYLVAGAVQGVAYSSAIYGLRQMLKGRTAGKASVPASFLMLNVAAIVGVGAVLLGRAGGLWKRR